MSQVSNTSAIHCINPDCPRPYPQPWGNKFCSSCGAPLQPKDRYIPLQRLGSGGFSQIYTVLDQKTQTEKVLKVLVEPSPKALELFAQEAEVLSSLRHPGVPRVDADGYFQINLHHPKPRELPCLVMEKINGNTLEDLLMKNPQGCPESWVLNWLTQAVAILQVLHSRRIIHRDIKPSNLMLRKKTAQLVLIDFGGAKQFGSSLFRQASSSTKLYSSGYSPPEQIVGGNVGPTVDIYALGRTMIEMLTGKSVSDLEDPHTGKVRWRHRANVSSQLADLLDEMVQNDVRSRPANVAIIQRRLAKMSQISAAQRFFSQPKQTIQQEFANLRQDIATTTRFIVKAIAKTLQACLVTISAMLMTGIGAGLGAIAGFILAQHTIIGFRAAEFISQQLPELVTKPETSLGSDIILFAAAGMGTGWALTASGGFGQRRRYLVASLMGTIGYGLGWLILQLITHVDGASELSVGLEEKGLVGLILVAVSLLTLGLGLRSHHIVHAIIAAFGTAIAFTFLNSLGFVPTILQLSTHSVWLQLWHKIAFFGFVGVFVSFWLGVSYYIVVPSLRFLGWR